MGAVISEAAEEVGGDDEALPVAFSIHSCRGGGWICREIER
jgi:hypothetical protein